MKLGGASATNNGSGSPAALALLALVALLSSCATAPPPPGSYRVKGQTYAPLARADGYAETGLASWYGPGFHGRRTSNGEIYDMHAPTAAHKLLPLGTTVRVTHLENGRQVTARINDRGPFVEGRIIDLSYALARELGLVEQGVARVRVEALAGPGGAPAAQALAGPFAWQVGSFAVAQNAHSLANTLRGSYPQVTVEPYDRGDDVFQRVRVGTYDSPERAGRDREGLARRGLSPILVRRD